MNILAATAFLAKAHSVYADMQKSGLVADIEASIEHDKEILAKLEANPQFVELLHDLEAFMQQPT